MLRNVQQSQTGLGLNFKLSEDIHSSNGMLHSDWNQCKQIK